jgi:tetratricopeptide (TPR) repeat protein
MSNKKFTTKGVAARGRIETRMVQNVLLIWLDQNIDDNNKDCQNTVAQLRCVVNHIDKYTNGEECIESLKAIDNEKVCMIISGSLARCIVPRVHDMSQVYSIFIFCSNKQYHEEWAKKWPKIKGVFTRIIPICEALKKAAQQCEQDSMSISLMDTSEGVSKKNLNHLEPSFMYTQILKEILLTIKFQETHLKQFITYCRDVLAENEKELKNLKKFEEEYRSKTPIWWYTYDCFLYRMLNRALWQMDADMIIKLGFFIDDLHRHIERLHQKSFDHHGFRTSFTVYRGQGMLQTEFNKMWKTKGGLISFNNFLSTSKNRNLSLVFANNTPENSKMVRILFVMKINPTQSTTPFASIKNFSQYSNEDEVLFSMHTVFRIGEVTLIDENNRLFEVKLTLTSDNDKELRELTDYIRKETDPNEKGWHRLGRVLLKMGESEKAEQVYEILLGQATAEDEKGRIYHLLGLAKYSRGEYMEAIKFYKEELDIYKRTLSPNDLGFSNCYSNIGLVYDSMGNYLKALRFHQKDLEIKRKLLSQYHPDLGGSYNNIGLVYYHMGDYLRALLSHEKALEIKKKTLPPNHPDLGSSYNNIGNVYYDMGDYLTALFYYEKDLQIKQQSLPPNHPYLGTSYNNIGLVYFKVAAYSKALSSYEKGLEISKESLPSNHPNLANTYNNIGMTYENMGYYSKARLYYERAVDIAHHSLPPNHPDLYKWRSNLERIMGKWY